MSSSRGLPTVAQLCAAALLACCAEAATLHVPSEYPTIQAGIDAAIAGDTVRIACGTYFEHDLLMKSGITLRSETGDAQCVVIDAGYLGRGISGTELDVGTRIAGITFTHGKAEGPWPESAGGGGYLQGHMVITNCSFMNSDAQVGGGLYHKGHWMSAVRNVVIEGNHAQRGGGAYFLPTSPETPIENCIFRNNIATEEAGGAYAGAWTPHFSACLFEGNQSDWAGGLYVDEHANIPIRDCQFIENIAFEYGGGIFTQSNGSRYERCTFVRNHANDGGGIYCYNGNIYIDTCLFVSNTAASRGGALFARGYDGYDDAPMLNNCTLFGNVSPIGGAIAADGVSLGIIKTLIVSSDGSAYECFNAIRPPAITCSIFYANSGGDWTGCIADLEGIQGNRAVDPEFCDPSADNFMVMNTSPCLPPNSNGCGLIGAFGQGCGTVSVESKSWGAIKGMYR